jgi:hypothetical protein
VHGLPRVFDVTRRPWIRADLADAEAVAEVVRRCPTEALLEQQLAGEKERPRRVTANRRRRGRSRGLATCERVNEAQP